MGKNIELHLWNTITVSGWWYCATQQETLGNTPVIMIPIVGTLILVIFIAGWIIDNWCD